MKRTSWPVIALLVTAPLLAASVSSASAAPVQPAGKNNPAPAAAAGASSKQPGLAPAVLANYQQVSASFADPANGQVFGSVACPTGTKVLSGGAVISSSSVAENLNSSIPTSDGRAWEVWVNNASGAADTFVVFAVCGKGIARYAIVNSGVSPQPPGLSESNQIQAACPQGSVVLGGGGFISSSSPLTMMAESEPGYDLRTWYSAYNNRSTDTANDTTYAVCGRRPAGYVHVHGTSNDVAPGTQASGSVSCPAGDVVLGGGGGPTVFWNGLTDLNSTAPLSSTTWASWENNTNSSQSFGVESSAVCATLG